jgi:hypothetical protein
MGLCEIFFYQRKNSKLTSRQLFNNYLQLVDQTFCCLFINPDWTGWLVIITEVSAAINVFGDRKKFGGLD